MHQVDTIIRATALNNAVRIFAASTTQLVSELARRHGTYPTASAALGRAATAGAIMGVMLKDDQKLTIQVKGNGPLGQIVVDANPDGDVRGYVDQPDVHLPLNEKGKLDVAGAVGREGFLYVIKDLGLKDPYRGSVPIVSGELAEDFTYYFAVSEQTPSAVALGVLVDVDHSIKAAGGLVVQLMPGVSEDQVDIMEQKLADLPHVTQLLTDGRSLEQIIGMLFSEYTILDASPVQFRCKCSRERVEQTLISLGKGELEAIMHEDESAEVICHFCNEKYVYDKEQLAAMISRME